MSAPGDEIKGDARVVEMQQLLSDFAEFERDADGYCDWCGTVYPVGHASDCIYPRVRAVLDAPDTPSNVLRPPNAEARERFVGRLLKELSDRAIACELSSTGSWTGHYACNLCGKGGKTEGGQTKETIIHHKDCLFVQAAEFIGAPDQRGYGLCGAAKVGDPGLVCRLPKGHEGDHRTSFAEDMQEPKPKLPPLEDVPERGRPRAWRAIGIASARKERYDGETPRADALARQQVERNPKGENSARLQEVMEWAALCRELERERSP